jgi:hypothetical protein
VGLREQAAADLRSIVTDESGFGWPITLVPPAGRSLDLVGLSTDVSQMIDPETGMAVSGRTASVALSIEVLHEAGVGIPVAVPETNQKPWTVVFKDIGGCEWTFKVRESKPDRAMGLVVCMLSHYLPQPTT